MPLVKLSEAGHWTSADIAPVLGQGWSEPEQSHVWAVGDFSSLSLPIGEPHPAYVVVLALRPIEHWQRVGFWSGATLLGQHLLTGTTQVSLAVPGELVAQGRLALLMTHYDHRRACEMGGGGDDLRLLSVALTGIEVYGSTRVPAPVPAVGGAALPDAALLGQFQSLGDNCEFGLVQRHLGAEPLHLLRFTGIGLPSLLLGLNSEFDGLDDPGRLSLLLAGEEGQREYILRHDLYGLNAHTFTHEHVSSAEAVLSRSVQKLALQRRMFLEDLEDAEKIFVLKRNHPLALQEVLPVWSALRGYGDNTLLYVVMADADHLPGTVEQRAPGLLCGYIDRFAPYEDAHSLFDECWLSICRNAHAIWAEGRHARARLLVAE
jgi:hypothetical protein